ncbi:MAG: hypothetical protein V4628_04365 [Pseudomonadota bacterium]
MTNDLFSRRQFLAASSSALALALVTPSVNAGSRIATPPVAGGNLLALYRATEYQAQEFAEKFARAGCIVRELSNDPVRQWRDYLGRLMMQNNVVLVGLSNWADYSILRGLAAEERRFPRMLMQHNKDQPVVPNWPSREADTLLQLVGSGTIDSGLIATRVNNEVITNTARPSLFSWII